MNRFIDSSLPDIKEYKNIFILDIAYEEITHTDEFYKLIKAIKGQESCSFLYTKKDSSSKQVYVHPYRLANFSNFWYLLAYDVASEKLKSYHINSINKVVFTNENYISNITVEQEIENTFAKFNSVWFDGNPKSIDLEVVGNAKLYIQRNFPKQAILIKETNSKLLLQLHYYNSAEVISFVKQWLPEVKILNNDKIKAELKDILQESLNNL
jgi:predicted DNA-binding transcriptional regulator YafY